MKILEATAGILLFIGAAYCGWRWLLFGGWLREKVHGEPEPPITLFTYKGKKK